MTFQSTAEEFGAKDPSTVVVLSDFHGNGHAAAAAEASVRELLAIDPAAHLVILGDLFTYGTQPIEVLDVVQRVSSLAPTWLVVGNHDEFYFPCLGAESLGGAKSLPEWIQESVSWSAASLGERLAELDRAEIWHRELASDGLILSHANPFGAGDWTYLRDEESTSRAAQTLRERGYGVGVFGHTHRRQAVEVRADKICRRDVSFNEEYYLDGSWVLNPGSIGQPREEDPRASFLILRRSTDSQRWTAEFKKVEYDREAHIASIESTDLSEGTIQRLVGFHRRRESGNSRRQD